MNDTTQSDRRRLLVDALRSGRYTQGKGGLRRDDNFCCLGVACDVFAKETGVGEWDSVVQSWNNSEVFRFQVVGDMLDEEEAILPMQVADWFGFSSRAGRWDSENALYIMNDEGVPFEKIADIIEDEPEGLFHAES